VNAFFRKPSQAQTDKNLEELFGINMESNTGEQVDTQPAALDHPMYLSPDAVHDILTNFNRE
jgi:hypothetical protein